MKALKLEMGDAPSAGGKLILKTAKGARDYQPHMMAVREKVLEKVCNHLSAFNTEWGISTRTWVGLT